MLQVLLRGDLDFAVAGLSSLRGQNLRILAIFADERHSQQPEIPIANELGVATSVPPGFNGVYAPKGLRAHIREALESACAKVVQSETVRHTIANTGQTVHYLTGAQFQARTAADYAFKGELLRRLGLSGQ
jgi:tripartite-type tricarboxylate transporter receptor subunit TctC